MHDRYVLCLLAKQRPKYGMLWVLARVCSFLYTKNAVLIWLLVWHFVRQRDVLIHVFLFLWYTAARMRHIAHKLLFIPAYLLLVFLTLSLMYPLFEGMFDWSYGVSSFTLFVLIVLDFEIVDKVVSEIIESIYEEDSKGVTRTPHTHS